MNPQLDYSIIDGEESEEILSDFQQHGFQFARYRSRTRSRPLLKQYLCHHIVKQHQRRTPESICSFLFRKLQDVITAGKANVKSWIDNCTNDKNLMSAYSVIINYHQILLRNTYGITVVDGIATINHSKLYPSIANGRRRVPMTAEELQYLCQLIVKYRDMNRNNLQVNFTSKSFCTSSMGALTFFIILLRYSFRVHQNVLFWWIMHYTSVIWVRKYDRSSKEIRKTHIQSLYVQQTRC